MRSLRQISRKHCMKAMIWHVCIVEKAMSRDYLFTTDLPSLNRSTAPEGIFFATEWPFLKGFFSLHNCCRLFATVTWWEDRSNFRLLGCLKQYETNNYLDSDDSMAVLKFPAKSVEHSPAPAPHFYKCSFSINTCTNQNWEKKPAKGQTWLQRYWNSVVLQLMAENSAQVGQSW